MPARLISWVGALLISLLLLTTPAGLLSNAAAAEEEIKCDQCNKAVKKSKAIKVIKDGKVYWVCSPACQKKLKK